MVFQQDDIVCEVNGMPGTGRVSSVDPHRPEALDYIVAVVWDDQPLLVDPLDVWASELMLVSRD